MALVHDGDVPVSGSYLPREIILSLLRQAGLKKTVALVVTNAAKFQGWIWPELLKHANIGEHLGDNLHSDGKIASAAGIKAIIYTGSHPTAHREAPHRSRLQLARPTDSRSAPG